MLGFPCTDFAALLFTAFLALETLNILALISFSHPVALRKVPFPIFCYCFSPASVTQESFVYLRSEPFSFAFPLKPFFLALYHNLALFV